MFAILIKDNIAEKSSVLPTIAIDDTAALILMLTAAESWCHEQEVDLGYTMTESYRELSVVVTCGATVVFSATAQSITSCASAVELKAFIDSKRDPST